MNDPQRYSNIYCIDTESKFQFLYSSENKENKETKRPNVHKVTKIKNPETVRKIVAGNSQNCLVWKENNTLEFYQQNQEKNSYTLDNEEIKDIHSGYETYLILTQSGKVFSLASISKSSHCEIPLNDPDNSSWKQIRPVPFFNDEKNNRKVQSITMVGWSNYFLCENGELYGNGYNSGRLGDGTINTHKNIPVLIYQNVSRVFGGVQCYCFFFTTTDNKLYAAGANNYGCLATGKIQKESSPVQISNWKADDILDLHCFYGHTILITKEGKTFGCGNKDYIGMKCSQNVKEFREITALKNKKAIKICGAAYKTFIITEEDDIYGWAFDNNFKRWNLNLINSPGKIPRKIDLSDIFNGNSTIEISCGTKVVFCYPENHFNSIREDFKSIFESKKYCDSKLMITNEKEISVHKKLVELRTNLKIEQIQKIINEKNFTKQDMKIFLKWIYIDQIQDTIILEKIFNSLNLSYPPKNKLEMDLLDLYKDQDTKDFNILVKIDDNEYDDDNQDDDDVNEEDDFEEIPVHKLILIARSGLFREMFDNIKENSNSVQDFSGKTIESLEILVKYFYTDEIELTADDDPELIVEELEDASEYYQLNKHSNLSSKLIKIKNQFDLK
ncbi:hypothetical protein M0812_04593 [Anaeramoeba flamelloides]|uniref:BTB domain-containing protein n=1 Tax=Anaeramoeba flamelloides TaxID=1746091 RepID=A0AAV8AIE9_9EUKA|nr:hypothetical protein M0812_04593 [Anaeramoeba flamelloides]